MRALISAGQWIFRTPEEIDIATRAGYGLRMPLTGVVQRMDFAGLDVTQKVLKSPTFQLAGQIRQSKAIDARAGGQRTAWAVKNGRRGITSMRVEAQARDY